MKYDDDDMDDKEKVNEEPNRKGVIFATDDDDIRDNSCLKS